MFQNETSVLLHACSIHSGAGGSRLSFPLPGRLLLGGGGGDGAQEEEHFAAVGGQGSEEGQDAERPVRPWGRAG